MEMLVRAYVKVRGKDAYRLRTPKEVKAVAKKKRAAQQRKIYEKFGLRVANEC